MGEENEKVEFKTSTAELQSALDSIVAILNKHQKGTLYFGVKNNGTPVGQIIGPNTLRDVSRTITDHIEPKIFPIVEKVILEGKECIKVEFEGIDIPYFANGRAFIRVSDEDKKITQTELKKMIIQTERKNNKWEELPSNITIDDIDEETLKKFIEKGNKKGRINYEYTTKEDILKRLNLIDKNGKIKNAGNVLFGKSPNVDLRCAIFATEEKSTFLDMQDYSGNIFKLIDIGEQYISKNIRWSANFNTGSFAREDLPEIPMTAIREALCNAFGHRSWEEPYSVNIAIYSNRIEIDNPGHFTEEATPNDYINKQEPSRPRNPLIVKILYLSGEIETWGTGLRKIYNVCKKENLKVDFEDRKLAFFVVLYRKNLEGLIENTEKDLSSKVDDKIDDKVDDKITINQQKIINLIIENPYIIREEISQKVGISVTSVSNNLKKLIKKGIIKRIGANKNGYWKLIRK